MSNKWQDFKFLDWDLVDPIGKYKQPMKNPRFTKGNGYPVDEVDLEGTKSFGRYIHPKGTKKPRMDIRGTGAAERGKRFYSDNEDRNQVRTLGEMPTTKKQDTQK